MAISYAAAARPRKKQPPPGRPPPKASTAKNSCETIKVSANNLSRINESERRTQILRRVPPSTTSTFIISELQRQLEVPISDVVEAVVQDCLDRRRYYVLYTSVEKKREVSRRGFELGDIKIPGERADVTGFVKDVPHYLTQEDMNAILGRYGDIVSSGFQTFEETNIRCGGFNFELDLHQNMKLPSSLRILNDLMTISQKDDIKVCNYCDRIGHLTRHCRKRIEELEKIAVVEMVQQEDTEQRMDEEEIQTNNDQETATIALVT